MSKLQLIVMDKDLPAGAISCGVRSIDDLIQDAYSSTLFKQALAFNIFVDNRLIGNCMVKLVSLSLEHDEDTKYYVRYKEYTALEISYLAIDTRIQGHGYGKKVLQQLILLAKKVSRYLPVRFLVLDAFKEKEEWYKLSGFKLYPKKEDLRYPGTLPMRIDLIDTDLAEKYEQSLI